MRAAVLIALLSVAVPAAAQEQAHDHHMADAPGWQWSAEGSVFFGYNYQYRKFTDFDEVESQNWVMTSLQRSSGSSRLHLLAMFSLEPFTLHGIGSPQVFQTGETFKDPNTGAIVPIIDYQHPHDLIMNLGGEYSRAIGATTLNVGAYVVGPAPLGPEVFMHRPSAIENPQSPLAHHHLDSTHVTPGVVSVGVTRHGFGIEAGAFHGREPDANHLDLDTGALDSYSVRGSWANGPWALQVSGGHLETPEQKSPYDEGRITASASYFKGDERRSLAWTAAFGQNRDVFGNLEAYLLEATKRTGKHAFYTRIEHVDKDILDAGFHPIGIKHIHRQSPVGALTLGYVREVAAPTWGAFGVGGDITGYVVPANLENSYGSPLSFHVFVHYRGHAGARMQHVH